MGKMNKFYYVVGFKREFGWKCNVMEFSEGSNIAGAFGEASLVHPCKTRKQAYELAQAWNEQTEQREREALAVREALSAPPVFTNADIDSWAMESLKYFVWDYCDEKFDSAADFFKTVRNYGREESCDRWLRDGEEEAVKEIEANRDFYAMIAEKAKASGIDYAFDINTPCDYIDDVNSVIFGMWAEEFFKTSPITNFTNLDRYTAELIEHEIDRRWYGIAEKIFGKSDS